MLKNPKALDRDKALRSRTLVIVVAIGLFGAESLGAHGAATGRSPVEMSPAYAQTTVPCPESGQLGAEESLAELLQLARDDREAGEWEGASNALLEVLRLAPGCAPAHRDLGTAYAAQGKAALAREAFAESLHLDPDDGLTYLGLGDVERKLGNTEAALAAYARAAAIQPRNSLVYHKIGWAYHEEARWDEAIAAFQRSVELRGETASAALAWTYRDAGMREEAVTTMERVVAAQPDDPDARVALGGILLHFGDVEAAIDAYSEALTLDPSHHEARARLSAARRVQAADEPRRLLNFWTQAMQRIASAWASVRNDPSSPEKHVDLGRALQSQGRVNPALRHFRAALELAPDFPDAHFWLGVNYASRQQWGQALLEYEEAQQLGFTYDEAPWEVPDHVGKALLETGEVDRAIATYEEAMSEEIPGWRALHLPLAHALYVRGDYGLSWTHVQLSETEGMWQTPPPEFVTELAALYSAD